MTKNYLIIHGTGGSPEINWFPWLANELKSQGANVISPKFPTPENHSLDSWLKTLDQHKHELQEPTVVIGHSLGCAFGLTLIEQEIIKADECFLVCPFVSKLGLEYYDDLNSSFVEQEFDWDRIKKSCGLFYGFAGSNDPYVSLEISKYVTDKLEISIQVIENGGHLNAEAGYREAEFLLGALNAR